MITQFRTVGDETVVARLDAISLFRKGSPDHYFVCVYGPCFWEVDEFTFCRLYKEMKNEGECSK